MKYTDIEIIDKKMKIEIIKKIIKGGEKCLSDNAQFDWDDDVMTFQLDKDEDKYWDVSCPIGEWEVDLGSWHYYYSDGQQRDWRSHYVQLDYNTIEEVDIEEHELIEQLNHNLHDKYIGINNIKIFERWK